ncbi:MAG TPA: carboxypeptidase-like regulatory domain-containing protein [Pyrinomonadaceae bacterium]|jgi:hypothetical protein
MRVGQFLIIREISLRVAVILLFAGGAAAQSGGQFTIEQTVIATGGGATVSSGGGFTLGGTTGQSIAGQKAANQPFSLHAGFWTATVFTPTAASVNLGGRVLTANGSGIRNVSVVLTMPSGSVRTTASSTFGYYHFENIPSGQTYILTANSKRFVFANPTQVIALFDERGDVDFITDSQP